MSTVVKHTSERVPRVSVGLPVYNGENYLAEAIDSLLAQTFDDFELIISDNASTDATEEICRQYAKHDPRIVYERQQQNLGAGWNQNNVIRKARGIYFKLAAHDDVCEPELLRRCIEEGDAHPEYVVVFPKTAIMVEGDRRRLRYWEDSMDTANPQPSVRFCSLLFEMKWCVGFRVFGVMRRDALMRTPLFGDYQGADHLLMTRMVLLAPFLSVPDRLFLYRRHDAQSINLGRDPVAYYDWWDHNKTRKRVFPMWRYARELIDAIAKAPIAADQKKRCYRHLRGWIWYNKKKFFRESIRLGYTSPVA